MLPLEKTTWECRVALARLGIHTDARITTVGIRNESGHERAYGLWGKTWYWQGWVTDVSLHDHTIIDLRDEEACVAKITRVHQRVLEAFERGLREYPDCIPCLSHKEQEDGLLGLTKSGWESENICDRPREHYPTENIPAGAETPEDGEALVRAQLENARKGLDVEDHLNTYTGPVRYIHDCKDRDWQFATRLTVRNHDGVQVTYRPREVAINMLSEAMAAELAKNTGEALLQLFSSYGAGGIHEGKTSNGLPPGFITLEEYRAEQDRRMAEIADDTGELEP
jgi:hypothetical protein